MWNPPTLSSLFIFSDIVSQVLRPDVIIKNCFAAGVHFSRKVYDFYTGGAFSTYGFFVGDFNNKKEQLT